MRAGVGEGERASGEAEGTARLRLRLCPWFGGLFPLPLRAAVLATGVVQLEYSCPWLF